MLNIKKIAELVELSKETGASIEVNIHDFESREEANEFSTDLFRWLNVDFHENEAETVGWFCTNIDSCNITVFYKLGVIENVG